MRHKILGIALGVSLGLPAVAFGGSFTYSLIQGKTPAEAITIIAEQIDGLFGRVDTLEDKQEVLEERITSLEEKSPDIDPALDERHREPAPVVELRLFAPSAETQSICDQAIHFEVDKNTLKGNIPILCDRVLNGKYETQDQYDSVVTSLHEKWELLKQQGAI